MEKSIQQQTISDSPDIESTLDYIGETVNRFVTHNDYPKYLMDISQCRTLSVDEEIEIAKKVEIGDEEAREILINANMWVVYWQVYYILRSMEHNPDSFMDLVQEGNIGLIKATYNFDYRYGVRFITFAASTIRRYVYNAVNLSKTVYRVPNRTMCRYNHINRVTFKLSKILGREPTHEELAEEMNISLSQLQATMKFFNPMQELKEEYNMRGVWDDYPNEDDPTADSGIQTVIGEDVNKRLSEIVNKLTVQEQQVIKLSFGFINGRVYSSKEIAAIQNITRQRVEKVKQNALIKIKQKFTQNDYDLFKEYML